MVMILIPPRFWNPTMSLHPLITLSPVLGLLILQLFSVGSTTVTVVANQTVQGLDNCTKDLCINDSCNWTLYWADKSVCYLLKCPSLEVCENITVQDLMFDKGVGSGPPSPVIINSTPANPADTIALKTTHSTLHSEASLVQKPNSSAGANQISNQTVDSELHTSRHNLTSTYEQPKATTTTTITTFKPKVSIAISPKTNSTTPPSPIVNTPPPPKSTARIAQSTTPTTKTVAVTLSPTPNTPLPATTATTTTTTTLTPPLPATTATTTTTTTLTPPLPATTATTTATATTLTPPLPTTTTTALPPVAPTTKLPQTTSSTPPPSEERPSPTTLKILNPPTPSENPIALAGSPESTTKGPVSSTKKPTTSGVPLTRRLVDTSSLLAVLLFGLLFFVVTVVLFLTQAYESYRRKDYTQVDYLINGMYSDSGV
ncbi:uncharacterized protein C11orf24 [Clupea harengus]|uniref:Uncharacterized protein C11orf24 n=1 Tax=Clupea harengus TaxID=7950 RepID=A0A6P3WCY6_CLUHA|nr:uncharacterized protein C11orf24 [Clupea harengus]